MARGIKVISWDSAVGKDGRIVHLNPSSNELIGNMCLKLAASHLPDGKGDFAILSATSTSTNQNTWIAEMKKQLPNFPGLNLVTTVYGDDLADKSYREAQGLLNSHPNVKVIVAPTTVGVLAASQAVNDAGKIGDVYVTGLGLPSEMAGAINPARRRNSPSGTRSTSAIRQPRSPIASSRMRPTARPVAKSKPAAWARSRSATTAKPPWPIHSSTTPRTSTSSPRFSDP